MMSTEFEQDTFKTCAAALSAQMQRDVPETLLLIQTQMPPIRSDACKSHCTIFTLCAGDRHLIINRAPWGLIYRTSPVEAVSVPSGGRALGACRPRRGRYYRR